MECNTLRNWLDNGWILLQWCTLNHDETWRCVMKCEDARVWESVVTLAHYCREAAHDMQNRSTHDDDIVLWNPVVMSCKVAQYQPVENWVSTSFPVALPLPAPTPMLSAVTATLFFSHTYASLPFHHVSLSLHFCFTYLADPSCFSYLWLTLTHLPMNLPLLYFYPWSVLHLFTYLRT
jgi:hypothetical protein